MARPEADHSFTVAFDDTLCDYPFHLIVDSSLALCGIGDGLRRVDPRIRAGEPLAEHFKLLSPEVPLSWEVFSDPHQQICLVHRSTGLELHGPVVIPEDGGPAMFLASSWLTDPAELAEFGLRADDVISGADPRSDDGDLLATLFEHHREARGDRERVQRLTCELSAIFQLSPDGFVAFDEAGIRSYLNPAFQYLTGITREQTEGIDEAAFEALLAPLLDPDRPLEAAADGSEVIYLAKPRPTVLRRSRREARDIYGRLFSRILYFRDITLETELSRANGEFLSNVAHELRTPMASIHGFAELLMRRELSVDKRREVLATMHSQSTRLIELINELLAVARFEARAARELDLAVQPLVPIVEQSIAELLVRDDPRKVVSHLPPAATSPWARVDRSRFMQALTNLLSNAYKYSPNGGEISVALRRQQRGGENWIGVAVRDHGIGLSLEEQAHLFERFYRARPSGRIPGTGLGMTMVKKILDLHDGDTEVSSAVGEGTEVTLWLREKTFPGTVTQIG